MARLVVSCEGLVTQQADDGGRGQDVKEAVAQLTAQGLQEWVLVSSEVKSIIWRGGWAYRLGRKKGDKRGWDSMNVEKNYKGDKRKL